MSTALRPIGTRYAGCHFRSRLEARWAVFFDALGIRWEYEPEGYELAGGQWYLPDFWLPTLGAFAEIKPQTEPGTDETARLREATALKMGGLRDLTNKPVVGIYGSPDMRGRWDSWGVVTCFAHSVYTTHPTAETRDAGWIWGDAFAPAFAIEEDGRPLVAEGLPAIEPTIILPEGYRGTDRTLATWPFPLVWRRMQEACTAARSARFERVLAT